MNQKYQKTNIFNLEDKLINCIKECLSNVSSFQNIARQASNDAIKKRIKVENEQSRNEEIYKKNNFEIILNSVIAILGEDKFKIEKIIVPDNCPFCKNCPRFSPYNINYIKINLDNYVGNDFYLKDFTKKSFGDWKCSNCQKGIKTEYNITYLPEILVIILGSKSQNKKLYYEFKTKLTYLDKKNNNNIKSNEYILKSLIGQIDDLEFKPFLFRNEIEFKSNFPQNENIFSSPTILFYEGPKKPLNEQGEYLENEYLRDEPNNDNDDNLITIFFNFDRHKKKIYIEIDKNEKFSNAIEELKEKYEWLNNLKNLKYYFNGKPLDNNKTLIQNGLQDNSEINII